jgi:hypothetical protein
MICLSQRDDADGIGRRFSESYKDAAFMNHPNPDPSFLIVVLTSIRTNKKKAKKHLFGFGEIKSVLANLGLVLSLIPFKINCNSNCSYISIDFCKVPSAINIAFGRCFSVTDITETPSRSGTRLDESVQGPNAKRQLPIATVE